MKKKGTADQISRILGSVSTPKEEVILVEPSGETKNASVSPREQVNNIEEVLGQLKVEIKSSCNENEEQIKIIGVVCAIIIVVGCILANNLYTSKDYDAKWSWQMIYFTTARVIAVSAFFYLVTYCFKLLKSYIFIYQRNRHRLFVINSLSNLLISAQSIGVIDLKTVFDKILEIIVGFDDAHIIDKKDKGLQIPLMEKAIISLIKDKLK